MKYPEAERIDWQEADDCCRTAEGQQKPVVTLDVDVTDNGRGLTVRYSATHPCGIADYAVSILVRGPGDTEWWRMRRIGIDPAITEWKFGPGEAALPVERIVDCYVYVGAFSTCVTLGEDDTRVRVF